MQILWKFEIKLKVDFSVKNKFRKVVVRNSNDKCLMCIFIISCVYYLNFYSKRMISLAKCLLLDRSDKRKHFFSFFIEMEKLFCFYGTRSIFPKDNIISDFFISKAHFLWHRKKLVYLSFNDVIIFREFFT